jgi:hypothetical protein
MHQFQNEVSILCIACSHNAPADILKDLLDIDPSSAIVADDHGMLPLHVACLVGAPAASIEVLLNIESGASAVGYVDNFQRTPLHYSAQHIIEPEFAAADAFTSLEETLSKGTGDGSSLFGSLLASSRATRNKAKANVNNAISISDSKAKKHSQNSPQKSVSDLSNVSISIDKFQDCLYTIHLLLSAYPESIHVVDKEDRTPIDILQDCIASNVNNSKYERADISCKMLREKAISLYIKQKQSWENDRLAAHPPCPSSASSVISTGSGFTNLSKLEIDGTSLNQMGLLSDVESDDGNDDDGVNGNGNGIGNNNSTRDNNVGNGIGNTVEVDDRFEIGNKSGQMKTIAEKNKKESRNFSLFRRTA